MKQRAITIKQCYEEANECNIQATIYLREQLAKAAMQGLCASLGGDRGWSQGLVIDMDSLARDAWAMADAMLNTEFDIMKTDS